MELPPPPHISSYTDKERGYTATIAAYHNTDKDRDYTATIAAYHKRSTFMKFNFRIFNHWSKINAFHE